MEKSRSMGGLHHLRLMALLQELVRDKGGSRERPRVLGVDHRTVTASLAGGEMSRRVREALERLLLARGGSAAARQREEMETLRKEFGALAEGTRRGLQESRDVMSGEVKALREESSKALHQLERRVASLEADRGARNEAVGSKPAKPVGVSGRGRRYPELVTVEPLSDHL